MLTDANDAKANLIHSVSSAEPLAQSIYRMRNGQTWRRGRDGRPRPGEAVGDRGWRHQAEGCSTITDEVGAGHGRELVDELNAGGFVTVTVAGRTPLPRSAPPIRWMPMVTFLERWYPVLTGRWSITPGPEWMAPTTARARPSLLYLLGGSDVHAPSARRGGDAVTAVHDTARRREFDAYYDRDAPRRKLDLHLLFWGWRTPTTTDCTRALRFAAMYTGDDPEAPNWDATLKMIRSPINGSRGPRSEMSAED